MTITDRPVNNGVNVEALLGAREALSAAPEAADFTWRASCTWRNGTHSRSTVTSFTGLGAEQQHRVTYEFDVDHPECFASEDNGATPVEYVLVGLAGGSVPMGFFSQASEVAFTTSVWGSRNDLAEVIALAQQGKLTATTETHRLDDINQVLQRLEHGQVQGRAVVMP